MKTIGFIGLGNMGLPMALNLLKAGYALKVFDLSHDALEKAKEAGGKACTSVAETVQGVDCVITMLPGDKAVDAVYFGNEGILKKADTKTILIDSSTINADLARKVAKEALAKGFETIDAPVSGGTAGAAAGTLTFIVGGSESTLSKVKPVLEKMGKNIFLAGTNGAGQTVKMCNNMLLGIMMIGTSEALNLGMKSGLDPKVMSEIMMKSSGRNWVLELYNPVPGIMENAPASRGYSGGFGSMLMAKDLGLAQDMAKAANANTPLGEMALKLYQQHNSDGNEGFDFSSIYNLIKD